MHDGDDNCRMCAPCTCPILPTTGVEGGDALRTAAIQLRTLQANITGPGRGRNAAARNAIYATCPKPVRPLTSVCNKCSWLIP